MRALIVLLATPTLAAAQVDPRLEPQTSGTTTRLQAVSVVSPQVAWVSGISGTYLRTLDGGRTWRAGVVPGADSLEFRDVEAFDGNAAVLLAAGPGDRSRIYRTEDGGATWTMVFANAEPKAFYDCLAFVSPREGYVVSDAVGRSFPMQRTTDGGRTWRRYSAPGFEGIAQEGEGAFAASGTCLAARKTGSGEPAIWLGTAAGARVVFTAPAATGWRAVETPIVRGVSAGIASLDFRDLRHGIAAGGDLGKPNDFLDNVAVTSDGGTTWVLAGRPSFPGPIYGIAYLPGRTHPTVVAVGPGGASWSAGEGKTWRRLDRASYWGLGFAPGGTGRLVAPAGRGGRLAIRG